MCEDLKQGAIQTKYDDIVKIRKAITLRSVDAVKSSIGKDLPIGTIISENIIPVLVEGVKCNSPKVQFECAWILSNIATGTEDQVVFTSCYEWLDARSDVFRSYSRVPLTAGEYEGQGLHPDRGVVPWQPVR